MLERCRNPKNKRWSDYGGRGIKCEFVGFEEFRAWSLENGYDDSRTLDRRDNDGPYSPENCRWTNQVTQQRNKRDTRWMIVNGRKVSMAEAAELTGVPYSTIRARLRYGATDEQAVSRTPFAWGAISQGLP